MTDFIENAKKLQESIDEAGFGNPLKAELNRMHDQRDDALELLEARDYQLKILLEALTGLIQRWSDDDAAIWIEQVPYLNRTEVIEALKEILE